MTNIIASAFFGLCIIMVALAVGTLISDFIVPFIKWRQAPLPAPKVMTNIITFPGGSPNDNGPWGIWAVRGPASIFGPAEAWLNISGSRLEFDTLEAATVAARGYNIATASDNIHYFVRAL